MKAIRLLYNYIPIKRRYIYLYTINYLSSVLNCDNNSSYIDRVIYCMECINIANYLFECISEDDSGFLKFDNFGVLRLLNNKINNKKFILFGDYFFTLAYYYKGKRIKRIGQLGSNKYIIKN